MRQDTQLILDQLDVLEILGKYELKVMKRSGDEISLRCPFHKDDNPSFSININTKLYRCFGCEARGNLVTLIAKLEKISYSEVAHRLLGENGSKDDYSSKLDRIKDSLMNEVKDEEVKTSTFEIYSDFINSLPNVCNKELIYLNSRNIISEVLSDMNIKSLTEESVELLKKKHNTKDLLESGLFVDYTNNGEPHFISTGLSHSIVFPFYYDTNIVAIQLRRLDNDNPRYLNIGDLICPYNINVVLKSEVIFLCEGIPDCLSLLTLGKPAVGIIGAQNFRNEWKNYFVGKTVFILFDNDEAGKKGAKYIQDILGDEIQTKIINLPDKVKDVNDFLKTKTFQYISSIRKGSVLKF